MYLDQLVSQRAEQEVKLENMSLDLAAAQDQVAFLEQENQRLRELAGVEAETKPLRSRRIREDAVDPPAIDGASKKSAKPSTSSDDASAPDLEIDPVEEPTSPPAIKGKPTSARRADDDTEPPDLSITDVEEVDDTFLPKSKPKSDDAPGPTPEPLPESVPDELPSPTAAGSPSEVASLTFDKSQSRGEDLDGQPGDEGVLVVLQPKDASGQYAPLPGSVVIEVIDSPTATREDTAAQVAEWKFTAEEVSQAMRNSALGRGAYLSVDWDEHRPAHDKLLIVARWTMPDGQELTAQQVVRVNLSKSTQAWNSQLKGSGQRDAPAATMAIRPSDRSSSDASKSWTPTRR